MSQENKMRICKYVHLSRQSNELGKVIASGWIMECFHLFCDILSAT